MNFGQVDNIDEVDFSIPPDHPDTDKLLAKSKAKHLQIYVGCAKWSKKDLKNFYPKGTKDELAYYSSQFNAIELNATFRKRYWAPQYEKWAETTPEGFKFCPKLGQFISHIKRLDGVEESLDLFAENASHLGDRMGVTFLQMHDNFTPQEFDRVKAFAEYWKFDIPIAIELRHHEWYSDPKLCDEVTDLFRKNKIVNILVDTAGRRDMMHMRLTSPTAFVRYVGSNHESDYSRLDAWVERVSDWKKKGLKELYFFVHQWEEEESPKLSAYFIEKLNKKIGTDLKVPELVSSS
jgi:uncharacterized protein YecE (DUF72 family)